MLPRIYQARIANNVSEAFIIKSIGKEDLNDAYLLLNECMTTQTHLQSIVGKSLRGANYKSAERQIYNLGLWLKNANNEEHLIGFCVASFEYDATLASYAYKINAFVLRESYRQTIHVDNLMLAALQALNVQSTGLPNTDNIRVVCKISEKDYCLMEYIKGQDIFLSIDENKRNVKMAAKLSIFEKNLNLRQLNILGWPMLLFTNHSTKRQSSAYLAQESENRKKSLKLVN